MDTNGSSSISLQRLDNVEDTVFHKEEEEEKKCLWCEPWTWSERIIPPFWRNYSQELEVVLAATLGLLDLSTAGTTWQTCTEIACIFLGILVVGHLWFNRQTTKAKKLYDPKTYPHDSFWKCDCGNGQVSKLYKYKRDTPNFRFKVQSRCEVCFSDPSKWCGEGEEQKAGTKEKPFGGNPNDWTITTEDVYCRRKYDEVLALEHLVFKIVASWALMILGLVLLWLSTSSIPGVSPLLSVAVVLDGLKNLCETFYSRAETEKSLTLENQYGYAFPKFSKYVGWMFVLTMVYCGVLFYRAAVAVVNENDTCHINLEFKGEKGGYSRFHQAVSWKSGRGEECPPLVRWDGEVPVATFCEDITFQTWDTSYGNYFQVSHREQCDFNVRQVPSNCQLPLTVTKKDTDGDLIGISLGNAAYSPTRDFPCPPSDVSLYLCLPQGTEISGPFNMTSDGNCIWT